MKKSWLCEVYSEGQTDKQRFLAANSGFDSYFKVDVSSRSIRDKPETME